jgi:hypothetical protein
LGVKGINRHAGKSGNQIQNMPQVIEQPTLAIEDDGI